MSLFDRIYKRNVRMLFIHFTHMKASNISLKLSIFHRTSIIFDRHLIVFASIGYRENNRIHKTFFSKELHFYGTYFDILLMHIFPFISFFRFPVIIDNFFSSFTISLHHRQFCFTIYNLLDGRRRF